MRARKSLLHLILLCFLVASGGCKKNKAEILLQTVEEVNKLCPVEIDHLVTLQSCEFVPDRTIKYNYIINANWDEINPALINEWDIINQAKAIMQADKSKSLQKLEPRFFHSYKNSKGEILYELVVTPEMYNTNPEIVTYTDDQMFSELLYVARELKQNLPVFIEDDCIMSDIQVIYPRTLSYSYILCNAHVEELDTIVFRNELKKMLREGLKNNNSDMMLRQNKVIYRHNYYDSENRYIASVNITPKDYK